MVSNRLPFSIGEENGKLKYIGSVGGVATGLASYLGSIGKNSAHPGSYIWVGWPGSSISDSNKDELRATALRDYRAYPVFLSEEEIEKFYQGFCNKTIWPLFHYFQSITRYDDEYWQQYVHVNEVFRDALLEILEPDDLLWVHDYHLMLLPALIRERIPTLSIGFFLHIPFPTYEVYRLLPATWRKSVLEGLLGSDVIGFHTYDYMHAFLRCTLRILGHEHSMGSLSLESRTVRIGAFPMGVDFNRFMSAGRNEHIREESAKLRQPLEKTKVVLSVDRLDYSKGIPNRLQGFATLLEKYPDWRGKVTLVMIVVPSRIGVEDYDSMKRTVEELVGSINGKYGMTGWTPIIYQFRALSFEPLVATYIMSDVALVTPFRDGMNLVAKEYVASRSDQSGVLVLSEMAGAAKEMSEAVIINPNSREEIAEALHRALTMPTEEQSFRNTIMQQRLQRYDVNRWAAEFITTLHSVDENHEKTSSTVPISSIRESLIEQYRRSSTRLLLLDYDGTLVPFTLLPEQATPQEEILALLRTLAADPKNETAVITGRSRASIEGFLGSLPISLIAEHGAWFRNTNTAWQLLKAIDAGWKKDILPILELYADRLPGAFVEEKEFSLVWHYRMADPIFGQVTARELTDDLLMFIANRNIQVIQGKKIVEVRSAEINKGSALIYRLMRKTYDFILAIGDDTTDEDMFAAMVLPGHTIHVGTGKTKAQYNIENPKEVIELLRSLANAPFQ